MPRLPTPAQIASKRRGLRRLALQATRFCYRHTRRLPSREVLGCLTEEDIANLRFWGEMEHRLGVATFLRWRDNARYRFAEWTLARLAAAVRVMQTLHNEREFKIARTRKIRQYAVSPVQRSPRQ